MRVNGVNVARFVYYAYYAKYKLITITRCIGLSLKVKYLFDLLFGLVSVESKEIVNRRT